MRPVLVLLVVGLTPRLVTDRAPRLAALARDGFLAPIEPVLPAVTCPVQSTYLTGALPREHGIVANGWYFRDLAEISFWRQSNRLVGGEKVWEAGRARDPGFTCAQLFWWYNMYTSADWSVTPRPAYPADGRKLPDVYASPPELRRELTGRLGPFPLFRFWGPAADLVSTRWIVDAALDIFERRRPTMTLVYLPHLDYNLQRLGPADPRLAADVAAVDAEAGRLIDAARAGGAEVVVLSEYGIGPVSRPVHLNRVLREAGFLAVHDSLAGELLDAGASRAFAVSDHQVAQVYVRRPEDVPAVRRVLEAVPGVERVLGDAEKAACGLDHPRSGELVAVAARDAWFTYYYWLDDLRAPDFARTVDIHRKPGYDPAELLLDPARPFVRLRLAARLAQKALGFRYLLDVIPLDATLVKGSHGRPPDDPADGAVLLASTRRLARDRIPATAVKALLLDAVFGAGA
ncbi:MAG: alkaline phosphatase family protein [Planctomycetes bacterium]|nr:alkaline phosphatase family protein [Planctomycetota bacterium]